VVHVVAEDDGVAEILVEYARGGSQHSKRHPREATAPYLGWPPPPPRLVVDREGNVAVREHES
jgi:hypothetical protein